MQFVQIRACFEYPFVLSFSSDWLYPPYQSEELVQAIRSDGLSAEYHMIDSSCGHDAFLLEADKMEDIVSRFLIVDGKKKYYEPDLGYPIS